MIIYFKIQVQIKMKTQIRALLFIKIFTTILIKYFNFSNIFLIENIIKLLKYIQINDYIIKL